MPHRFFLRLRCCFLTDDILNADRLIYISTVGVGVLDDPKSKRYVTFVNGNLLDFKKKKHRTGCIESVLHFLCFAKNVSILIYRSTKNDILMKAVLIVFNSGICYIGSVRSVVL